MKTQYATKTWVPYVIPFAVFLLFTEIGNIFPHKSYIFYLSKTLIVGSLLLFWYHKYNELKKRPCFSHLLVGAIVGLALVYPWVAWDNVLPKLGESSFDPFSFTLDKKLGVFIAGTRIFGAVMVVPLMEELFWRSFLMRFLINKNFEKVPLGSYQHFSFFVSTFLFGLEHFRIIPGILAGLVYAGLVCWTKNLWPAILAHALTNMGLGLYILLFKQWQFW